MRHKKDLYFVVAPSDVDGYIGIGERLIFIPGDNRLRVYCIAAGPEYRQLVYEGERQS